MNFVKKPLVLLLLLSGGLAAFLIELNRPAVEHRPPNLQPDASRPQASEELVLQLESLKAEKATSLSRMASLEAEVRRLRKELAVHAPATGAHAPRSQPSQRADGEPAAPPPEETPFARAVLDLAIKAGRLNAVLQQHPERDIPELQYLDEGEWIHFAKEADLDSEEGISKALAELRKSAKSRFADLAREGLSNYAKANGGQSPSSIGQLSPYLPDSITPALLERYQLIPANSPQSPASADIGGPMILREKDVVDPRYDTRFDIGPGGWTSTSTGTGYIKKQFR
jgi:hypothetical protein